VHTSRKYRKIILGATKERETKKNERKQGRKEQNEKIGN
jgi:hypothetical protein